MRTIKILDDKNYEPHWKKYKRDSARAIIFRGNKLAMVQSEKYGECKFPGGGVKTNESFMDAAIREVLEETGLHVLPGSLVEYGKTIILRKDTNGDGIFEQVCRYYTCDVDLENCSSPKLDDGYETEYGYKLTYVSPDEAIEANEKLLNKQDIPYAIRLWTKRDLAVLYELKNMGHDNVQR